MKLPRRQPSVRERNPDLVFETRFGWCAVCSIFTCRLQWDKTLDHQFGLAHVCGLSELVSDEVSGLGGEQRASQSNFFRPKHTSKKTRTQVKFLASRAEPLRRL